MAESSGDNKKQHVKDAIEKLKGLDTKEQHSAIANLLATGDEFSQALVLFDIMIDTDTVRTLLIDDDLRIQTLCKFYWVEISDTVQQLLVEKLAQCKQARKANILLHSGVQEEREAFVVELTIRNSLLQNRYKQK